MPVEDLNVDAGEKDHAAGGPDDSGKEEGQETIALEEHTAKVGDLQRQVEELTDQNRVYRAQINLGREGGGGGNKAGAQDSGFFAGRDEEDVPTVGELRQFEQHLRQEFGGAMGEIQLSGQKTDYQEVVSNHLPNFLRANPYYIQVLRSTPPQLRPRLAYDLGIQDPAYQVKKNKDRLEKDPNLEAEAIARNLKKPKLGGKGGGSPLSQASHFEAMDMGDELEKEIARVLMGVSSG